MQEMIAANWLVFVLALLIGLLVAWWIFARGSAGAKPGQRKPDALDQDAPPLQRNQAFIDAPPAAEIVPPAMAGTMAGMGEVIAVAAQEVVDEAQGNAAPSTAQDQPDTSGAPAQDDLRQIKGVGPKLVTLLQSLGVTSFAQISGWDEADIDRIDAQLGTFAGRIRRDSWIEQARLLQGKDQAAYEAKFGKL